MRSRDRFERCDHVVPSRRFSSSSTHKRLGFTIIDLLVSLAIISLMLATISPALKHAKLVSQRAVCMVHEHEQGQFIERYGQDYLGYFPWYQYQLSVDADSLVVGTTVRQFNETGLNYFDPANLICPLDAYQGHIKYTQNGQVEQQDMSFAFNVDLLVQRQRVHFIQNPSVMVTTYDGSMSGETDGGFSVEGYYAGSYDAIEYARMNRHLNMANVLYLDGHVETQIRFAPTQLAVQGATFVAATWAVAQDDNTPVTGNGGGDDTSDNNTSNTDPTDDGNTGKASNVGDTTSSDSDNGSNGNSNGNGNNGHGNNDDDVDSSNPGNGNGGPNGKQDPSGDVDDESKGNTNSDNSDNDTTDSDEDNGSNGKANGNGNGKSNNGHGNNDDGVDVSNPGQGNGGPNGQDDPSGDVDDESKGGGNGKGKKK